jgi:PAS domain S-box-containing protein
MKAENKTKKQLINELAELRQRIVELEACEAKHEHVEKQLHESEASFNRAQRIAQFGSWDWDLVNDRGQWSDGLYRIFGLRKKEFCPTFEEFLNYIHPDDRAIVKKAIDEAFHDKKLYDIVYRMVRSDGSLRVIQARAEATFGEDDQPIRLTGTALDITERRQLKEALRISEEKYRVLVEKANEAIGVVQDGLFRYVNPKALALTGYSKKELIQQPISMIMHPDDEQMLMQRHFERLKGSRASTVYPIRIIDKQGDIKWVLMKSASITWEGKQAGLHLLTDITEHQHLDEALAESEEKMRLMFESVTDGIIVTDLNGIITEANIRVAKLHGFTSKNDLLGKSAFTLIAPKDRERAMTNMQKRLAEGLVRNIEYSFLKIDGSEFPGELNVSAITDASGQSVGLIGIIRDVTERKQAEEALRASEERLRLVFDSAPDATVFCDLKGYVVDGNRKMEDITGYKRSQLIGKHFSELQLLPQREIVKAAKSLASHTLEGPTGPYLYTINRQDGTQAVVEVRTYPVKHKGQDMILGIVRDISERKRAETQLLSYQKELRSLVSQLSLAEERERQHITMEVHDRVSQYLALCRMRLDAMLATELPEGMSEQIQEINGLIQQLIEEVRSLMFQLSSPLLHEVGLEAALEQLTEQMQAEHGIQISFEDDGQYKSLDHDVRGFLFQTVRELLMNVVKHAQADHAKVCTKRHDASVQIIVEDNGIGFDPASLSYDVTKAKGFGLFSIRERLHYIGGHIDVESERGHGTRVTILAPLNKEGKGK